MITLTTVEIERRILTLLDALEAETYSYADLSDLAAQAEADYKIKSSKSLVHESASNPKMTIGERQARVEIGCAVELRAWKVSEARRQASKEALLSLRARLDALRSLSANVRAQT